MPTILATTVPTILATTMPLVPRCPPLAAWSEELWPGCLADSHCHLDLVLRCLAGAATPNE